MTVLFVKKARLVLKCARIVLWPAIYCNTIVVALFSTSASFSQASLIAVSLCCVASFGFLINDCRDVAVDRINHSNRLENASSDEVKLVWRASFAFLAIAVFLSLPMGLSGLIPILIVTLGLAIYTFYARKRLAFATVLAAILSSTPLWITSLVFDSSLPLAKMGIIFLAVLLLMGREIIFDVGDMVGDFHGRRRTFATVFSKEYAFNLAIALNLFGGTLLCLLLFLDKNIVSTFVAWTGVGLFFWLMYWPLFKLKNRLEKPDGIEFFTSQSRLAMLLLPLFWIIF